MASHMEGISKAISVLSDKGGGKVMPVYDWYKMMS
jgi:hypothetical protein